MHPFGRKPAIAKQFSQERLAFEDNRLVPALYGEQNNHLQKIEHAFDVEIASRGNELTISGPQHNIVQAKQVLEFLWKRVSQGQDVDAPTVDGAIRFQVDHMKKTNGRPLDPEDKENPAHLPAYHSHDDGKVIITKKKRISARTPMQGEYIAAMKKHRMVFGIGPAGTGKTYLAIARAVEMVESGKVERIILTRPAVEAGERLGFLPGELKEKMDPYMRPLYDALYDTMPSDKVQKKILSEEIEIAPLAFMRGRTLNNAFIILDEAQNTTTQQMLMFLTRMGENSHMLITGDPSQIDLPPGVQSGLKEAMNVLKDEDDIKFIYFKAQDVVRHKLVARVIQAYDKFRKKDD
ncbi:MAG TPA: PhoH family protein [Micavibrio sp.]